MLMITRFFLPLSTSSKILASFLWCGPTLKPGDIVLLHYLDSLPRSLALVMKAAKQAGLRPALLRDYLLPAEPQVDVPQN